MSESGNLWCWILIILLMVIAIILQLESEHIADWLAELIEKYFRE